MLYIYNLLNTYSGINLFPIHACRIFILSFIFSYVFTPVSSQTFELKFTHIVDEKGEDPGATFDIVSDLTGFIWFGTVDGLYRYDGFNYKIYRNQKDNPNSLSSNTIRALATTSDQKIWIGTQGGGLNSLDLTTGNFKCYPYIKKDVSGLIGTDIWELLADRKGNIWIGPVGDGIYMLDRKTDAFKFYPVFPADMSASNNITVRALFEDSRGRIWVGMVEKGVSVIDPETGSVKNFRHNPIDRTSLGSNNIYEIFEDSRNRIFICSYEGGLSRYEENEGIFTNIKLNKNATVPDLVIAGIEHNPGEYWIGTEYGLYIYIPNNNALSAYKHRKDDRNSLGDNRIRKIFKDKGGIFWIATEAGVDKIVEQKNFRTFKHNPDNSSSIPEGIVRSIYQDTEGNIWFGIIDKGLVKYHPGTNKFTRYLHHPKIPGTISGFHITSVFQDSEGDMWFGEWDTGLNKFNKQNGTFQLVAGTKKTRARLKDTRIQFIREAKPGFLWIGTEGGINLYDKRKDVCTYILHEPGNPNSLSANAVQSNAFVQDTGGNLWVGTWSGGLNKIEFLDSLKTRAKFTHWKFDPAKPENLNNSNVISLLLKDSILWIGTFGGGLNRMDLRTEKFTHYTTEKGLSNNIIFAILDDKHGYLWLSTDRGLSKFNPDTETFWNYGKSDGLQDDHFFWGSSFKSQNGELFFGGIGGVNSFSPDQIIQNAIAPSPAITEIKIFEKPLITKIPIQYLRELELSYNQNYITIEFTGLDYSDPDKNQYMIKLDGLDREWHYIGNRRFNSWSNLAPGNYIFRLKVANKDGIWNQEELILSVYIKPPWWNTLFARIIYGILIIGGLLTFYYIRIGILKKQTTKLEIQVGDRTAEISRQKEELRTINEELTHQKEELSNTLDTLKRTQEKLIESEKIASLGVFTAGIAHEINNPLNYLQAGLYGLENFFIGKNECTTYCNNHDEIKMLLDSMQTGIYRVTNIISGLNRFNRQVEGPAQMCSLHAILDNCLLILDHQIMFKAKVKKEYSAKNDLVMGHEGKLHQLMMNIILNAAQAIENVGEIAIITHNREHYLIITVSDNGCGIPKEDLSRIFDPFFTTKAPGLGTGLGLSISYGIIKEHNGDIEYFSEPGAGTKAIITLPVKE